MAYESVNLVLENVIDISLGTPDLSGLTISGDDTDPILTSDYTRYIGYERTSQNSKNPVYISKNIYNDISNNISNIKNGSKILFLNGKLKARQINFEHNNYILNIYANNILIQSINDCFENNTDLYGVPNTNNLNDIHFEFCLNHDSSFNSDITSYELKIEIQCLYNGFNITNNIALYLKQEDFKVKVYKYIKKYYHADDNRHVRYVLIKTQDIATENDVSGNLFIRHLQSWYVDTSGEQQIASNILKNNKQIQYTNTSGISSTTTCDPSVYIVDSSNNVIITNSNASFIGNNRFKQGYNQTRIITNDF